MKKEMTDEEIINAYFEDPLVKSLMTQELGRNGKIEVDWIRRKITAKGTKSTKIWNMDEFLNGLKYGEN